MNCWEILGIDPTRDRDAIDRAYEQQKKFADGEELERLHQAYREASGEPPQPVQSEQAEAGQTLNPAEPGREQGPEPQETELTAEDQQVVREVVIQIKALLNDSRRAADAGLWRAILTEPPADQTHIRDAVARALEPQVRPMAENGSFPSPVVAFLGDWFGWHQLSGAGGPVTEAHTANETLERHREEVDDSPQTPVTNFWPAVIGWIVALGVLAVFFEGIFGG